MQRVFRNVLIMLGAIYSEAWISFAGQWLVAKSIPAQGLRGPAAGSLYWMQFGYGMLATFVMAILVGWAVLARGPYPWATTFGLLVGLRWYAPHWRSTKPIRFAVGTLPLWSSVAALLAFCGVVIGFWWRARRTGPPPQGREITNAA